MMNGELPNKPLFSEHLASKGIFFIIMQQGETAFDGLPLLLRQ